MYYPRRDIPPGYPTLEDILRSGSLCPTGTFSYEIDETPTVPPTYLVRVLCVVT